MKSFFFSLILILSISTSALSIESSNQCPLGDAIIQFAGKTYVVDCITYNTSHEKWEFLMNDKVYLVSPQDSLVYNMDGQLSIKTVNGKKVIKLIPTFSYYIVRKDMSEPPVGVDEVGVSRDFIVAYNVNTRGDRCKTIYSTLYYEAITFEGDRVSK